MSVARTRETSSFEIIETLGVGAMATVYLARRVDDGETRTVALKKPHAFLAGDPAMLSVLQDEAQLGACIRHPNVVSVTELVAGEEPALVMEWIDGVDLGKLIAAAEQVGRRLPVDVVAALMRDVLAGLHAAHESRRADGLALEIVHRDVSPQNVLVGFDGSARIGDFGVAKAAWRQQHTENGAVKGKLRYLAPEQLSGRCDRRADVYSVGAVMWELLTGARMRTGSGVEMLVDILCGQVQAPGKSAADAACLDAVVMRALEGSADDRFATAASMREAIERAVTIASPARVAAFVRDLMGVRAAPSSSDEQTASRRRRARAPRTNVFLRTLPARCIRGTRRRAPAMVAGRPERPLCKGSFYASFLVGIFSARVRARDRCDRLRPRRRVRAAGRCEEVGR